LGLISDDAIRWQAVDRADQGEQAMSEIRMRRKDGTIRVIESAVQILAGGQFTLMVSRDITERRQVDAQLQASEQRLQGAFESMLDALSIISPVRDDAEEIIDFRFDYVNDAYCALVGLVREQLQSRRGSEVYAGFPDSEGFATFRRVATSGVACRTEDTIPDLALDGTPQRARLRELSVVPVGDSLMVSQREITDLR
jgi:PAS domain-containing protein